MSNHRKGGARLEQLRKAGVEVPDAGPAAGRGHARVDGDAPGRAADRRQRHAEHPAPDPLPPADPPRPVRRSLRRPTQRRSTRRPARPAQPACRNRPRRPWRRPATSRPKRTARQIADEFRVIKRPIIKNAHWKSGTKIERGNRVMVTSALPGEGKTFVAINLALEHRAGGRQHRAAGRRRRRQSVRREGDAPAGGEGTHRSADGRERLDLADVLLRTNVEKLSLLPAGTPHRRATEMLASRAMADARRRDVDAVPGPHPRLRLAAAARHDRGARAGVAHGPDRHGRRSRSQRPRRPSCRALETIESCPIVLMVLNKARAPRSGGYYGYGATAPTAPRSEPESDFRAVLIPSRVAGPRAGGAQALRPSGGYSPGLPVSSPSAPVSAQNWRRFGIRQATETYTTNVDYSARKAQPKATS